MNFKREFEEQIDFVGKTFSQEMTRIKVKLYDRKDEVKFNVKREMNDIETIQVGVDTTHPRFGLRPRTSDTGLLTSQKVNDKGDKKNNKEEEVTLADITQVLTDWKNNINKQRLQDQVFPLLITNIFEAKL